jgi:hypothetical protein
MIAIPFIGLLPVLFGSFSRTFTYDSTGDSCFMVDVMNWGGFCWPNHSIIPQVIVYGANMLGLAFCIYWLWTDIQARRAKARQRTDEAA